MTKLNDLQSIMLTAAAQRETGSVFPLPESIANAGDRVKKTVPTLLKRGLVEEGTAADAGSTWRTDGDDRFGLFITAAGRTAIGVDTEGPAPAELKTPSPSEKPVRSTKSAAIVSLLQRAEGATLADLIAATGWLPHTTRAALTGLRKKGHAIEKSKCDDVTCYRIV